MSEYLDAYKNSCNALSKIASKYNGGGHPLASGARVKKQEDIDKLFTELDNECLKYNKNI